MLCCDTPHPGGPANAPDEGKTLTSSDLPAISYPRRLYWSAYTANHCRGQVRYPFRSLKTIEGDRDRRAQAAITHAYRWVPYYRESMDRLGLRPWQFETADDLARLPLLRREQVQRDPEYFTSTRQPLSAYLRRANSGSTGTPCVFYNDTAAMCHYAACYQRLRAPVLPLLGRLHGYRKTSILGVRRGRLTTNEFYQQLLWMPPGVRLERQALSLLDAPEYNLPLINQFRPDVLEASGSYLATLFAYVESSGTPMHRPKALLYTLDALPETARCLIAAKYGIPVFGTYEAQEANCLAFECEQHEHYHVNIDLAAVRIVDEEARSVSPGEPGNVVISNLVLRGTVLLNYMLDDVAAWVRGVCECGRSLPRLGRLVTRLDDWLELPSGRRVHPHIVPGLMLKEEGIWQYQVTQESPHQITVAVVCAEQVNRPAMAARLQERFGQVLGSEVEVRVEYDRDVQRTARGKVRPLVSLRTRGWLERSTSP